MTARILQGDCREVLRTLPAESIDSIVTDPPYGLGKEPDALAMLADWLGTGHHDVQGTGFMGKAWDAFVPQPALWRECLRVLKPGGHLLAFAGTRTHDLMTLGLRIAGFEIRDTIMWVYGSGFPKSLDVSKAIDRAAGKLGPEGQGFTVAGYSHNPDKLLHTAPSRGYVPPPPATPDAERWQGWGTALKPALEPITVARKPLEGTVAANVLAHGTGALNIDGCRVAHSEECKPMAAQDVSKRSDRIIRQAIRAEATTELKENGRWPANVIHDGSDEVVAMFPADKGSAARFFYCAKASRADRNAGCDGLPQQPSYMVENGSRTAAAANGVRYDRTTVHGNNHPTVKPTTLMRYLVRLVTPPGGTVLDPFTGSGSTGRACALEGFAFIGCELSADYIAIANTRIADAQREANEKREEAAAKHPDLFAKVANA